MDAVHPYRRLLAGELNGGGLREQAQSAFRRVIGAGVDKADLAQDRADIDNRRAGRGFAAPSAEQIVTMLGAQKSALDVNRLDAPPGCERQLLDGAYPIRAGVVDQNVQALFLFADCPGEALPVGLAGHVGAKITQACGHALPGRVVEIGDENARPFGGEAFGDGLADTAQSPGYQSDLSRKPHTPIIPDEVAPSILNSAPETKPDSSLPR